MKKIKSIRKIAIVIITLMITMLVLPVSIVKFAPADAGMALCFILFFAVDPFTILALSIMAGTELPKLWWVPVAGGVAFPLFFGVAVGEVVTELFVYSALYAVVGFLAMLGMHYGIKITNKRKMSEQENHG